MAAHSGMAASSKAAWRGVVMMAITAYCGMASINVQA